MLPADHDVAKVTRWLIDGLTNHWSVWSVVVQNVSLKVDCLYLQLYRLDECYVLIYLMTAVQT